MLRSIVFGLLVLALPATSFANAVIESLKGEVQWGGGPVFQGQRVGPQGTFTTGAGSEIFLRFDDGMQIVLSENSLLRVVDFRNTNGGSGDRAVFELLRGAARVVTGSIAHNSPKQFFFRTTQTQLMVQRPSDFTVVLVNPAYVAVHSGSLIAQNNAGVVFLEQGSTTVIASSSTSPAAINASQMPQTASATMRNLSTASVSAPGGPGAGAPVGGAAFGAADFALPALAIGGAAAGAAALLGGDDSSTPTPSHH